MGFWIFLWGMFASIAVATPKNLSDLITRHPAWKSIEANSEQRQPYHLEDSVRDIVISGKRPSPIMTVPLRMKVLAEEQMAKLKLRLGVDDAEFEVWPARNDEGDETWVFARIQTKKGWRFVEDPAKAEFPILPVPFVPQRLSPQNPIDHTALFTDFLKQESLYAKPLFADCVWASAGDHTPIEGWLPPSDRKRVQRKYGKRSDVSCFHLPQPARWNGTALSFVLKSKSGLDSKWEPTPNWVVESPPVISLPEEAVAVPIHFDETTRQNYEKRIRSIAGEDTLTPTGVKLTRKNCAQPDHQLEILHDSLEAQYRHLGLKTERQRFKWRGISQSNVIAKIPAIDSKYDMPPLILADHTDTAFAEDTYEKTGKRVSNPGADDNATATAALMMAGETLSKTKLQRPIWLVHFTGEEYPSDDLGARKFIERLFSTKQDVFAVVILDMIGHRAPDDKIFQINPGRDAISKLVAQVIAAEGSKSEWVAKIRDRFDPLSYLYNTDAYIFETWGFPVVLVNEHLNRTNMDTVHPHYHQSSDSSVTLDLKYAFDISRVAIQAAWQLCAERGVRNAAAAHRKIMLD